MSRDVNEKPKYEIPLVMSLGEQARAVGAACKNGTNPEGGACNAGLDGFASCGSGTDADTASCVSGTRPGTECNVGSTQE
jgi:hypothetical protein